MDMKNDLKINKKSDNVFPSWVFDYDDEEQISATKNRRLFNKRTLCVQKHSKYGLQLL